MRATTPDPPGTPDREATVLIDCDSCAVRDIACHDCVVGVLLGTPSVPSAPPADGSVVPSDAAPGGPLPLEFGPVEQRALEVLADHGLIPRLRLVPPAPPPGSPREQRGAPRPRRARDAG
ncbi:hypothetical protein Acsp06_35950 [Actinomycetospora sp. NBRC 106375]|uniref:hypothetical protein n=1 Tax=Actinomycetospora sp. NBRC 106375 TaxID=3032207 RepID=UPI0024A003E1|nr:hypothetical protein Acsp06_35950 [Actinomycetospora sp. NBRC 106375]